MKVLINLKYLLSWDCAVQLEHMNLEWLVIVGQHTTVKQFLIFVLIAHHTIRVLKGLNSLWGTFLTRGFL